MGTRYLNAARARRAQVGQLMAQLNQTVAARAEDLTPLSLVAFGDMINADADIQNLRQVIDLKSRLPLAYKLATYFSNRQREALPEFTQARFWGDLHASWMVATKTTRADSQASLAEVLSILRTSPPDRAFLLATMQGLYNEIRASAAQGNIPWEEASSVMPEPRDPIPSVPLQKFKFFEASLHHIPEGDLFNSVPDASEAMGRLRVINQLPVMDMPDVTWSMRNDYETAWAALTDTQRLAVYEMIYYHDPKSYDAYLVASVVGVIFSLCKQNGMTAGYVNSRVQNVIRAYPDLQLEDKLQMEFFTEFQKLYLKDGTDKTMISTYLQAAYAALEPGVAKPIAWVIEQARGHSYTHITAFANVASKHMFLPILFLDKVSETEWQEFAKAAYHICRDPWGSLAGPAIPASACPDVSNLGVILQKKTDKAFKQYAGGFISGGKYNEHEINAIADVIRYSMSDYREAENDLPSMIARMFPGIKYKEIGDATYFYDTDPHVLALDPANVVLSLDREAIPRGEGANMRHADDRVLNRPGVFHGEDVAQVLTDETRGEARPDWPAAARRLPNNAVRMTSLDMINFMVKTIDESPKLAALKVVCECILLGTKQVKLTPYGIDPNNVRVLNRYAPSPNGLDEALLALFIDPATVIPGIPPDAAPVPYDAVRMDNIDTYRRPVRGVIPFTLQYRGNNQPPAGGPGAGGLGRDQLRPNLFPGGVRDNQPEAAAERRVLWADEVGADLYAPRADEGFDADEPDQEA